MAVQPGLCRTWSGPPKTGFLTTRLKCFGPLHKLRARLGPSNRLKPPPVIYISDRSKAIFLKRFSVLLVFVPVSVLFLHSMCLDDVLVAEWPPFGKELHIRLTACSLCFMSFNFVTLG